MRIDREELGRWSPEFRAWLTAFRSGKATREELEELDRAAQEAGERLRQAARQEDDALEHVTVETEDELDILAALRPSLRGELSPSLVAALLADDLDEAIT